MSDSKAKTVALWVAQIILAIFFLLAALGKLTSNPGMVERFSNWGLPDNFYLLIGGLELLGAIGLLIPRTSGHAALGLFGIMIGAVLTHLLNGEAVQVVRPGIFMLVLAFVLYARRPWPLKPRG